MDDWHQMRHITSEENKLRLLYCVNLLGYVTDDQLWLFVARLDLMDYFSFRLLLDELKQSGALRASEPLNGALLITAGGYRMLGALQNTLPNSDRDRMRELSDPFRKQLEERRAFDAVHELPTDGLHAVRITLCEGGETLLILRVLCANPAVTAYAVNHVREIAPRLLQLLYLLPAQPCEPDEIVPMNEALSECRKRGQPLCAADSGGRFAGTACVSGASLRCEMQLSLPGAALSFGWAKYVSEHGDTLCNEIAALLPCKGDRA